MAAKTVSVTEICRVLAGRGHEPLVKQAISQFVAEGMPKESRGQYSVEACVDWYIGRLRTAVQRKESVNPDGSTTSLEDERKRLIAAQADNEEMTAKERRGDLMPVELYRSRMAEWALMTKQRFLGMVPRLADRVEGRQRSEIKETITEAVRANLVILAGGPDGADAETDHIVIGDAVGVRAPEAPRGRRSVGKKAVQAPAKAVRNRLGGKKQDPPKGNDRKARTVRR